MYSYIYRKDHLEKEPVFINRVILDYVIESHAHEFLEVAYVYAGKGKHTVNGKEYEISEGDVFFINSDIVHSYKPKEGLIIYNCIFSPEFFGYSLGKSKSYNDLSGHFLFRAVANGMLGDYIFAKPGQNSCLKALFDKMYDEYTQKSYGYVQILRAYTIELLVTVFRNMNGNENPTQQSRPSMEPIFKYIEENFSKGLSLCEVAAKYYTSPSYFSRVFKHAAGCTFKKYVQKLRIENACKLIAQQNLPCTKAAVLSGFNDFKNFSAVFKEITGKSPGEFKKGVNLNTDFKNT